MTEAARAAPLLPQRWSELSTMTISYGHGLAVSPLHLAAAYAAHRQRRAAGRRRRIIASDAPADRGRPGDVARRPRARSRDMLRQVVARGTAKAADVAGLRGRRQDRDRRQAARRGRLLRATRPSRPSPAIFPASDPQYVLVVALDEPTTRRSTSTSFRTAGLTAAPVLGQGAAPAGADHGAAARRRAGGRRAGALHAGRERIAGADGASARNDGGRSGRTS